MDPITGEQFLEGLRTVKMRREEVEADLGLLLTRRGWTYTCNTPGSCWMWEKKLPDGRTLLLNPQDAALLEEREAYASVKTCLDE